MKWSEHGSRAPHPRISRRDEFELALARRAGFHAAKQNQSNHRKSTRYQTSFPIFQSKYVKKCRISLENFVTRIKFHVYSLQRKYSLNLRILEGLAHVSKTRLKKGLLEFFRSFREIGRVRNASWPRLEMHFRFNRQLYSQREIMMILLCLFRSIKKDTWRRVLIVTLFFFCLSFLSRL